MELQKKRELNEKWSKKWSEMVYTLRKHLRTTMYLWDDLHEAIEIGRVDISNSHFADLITVLNQQSMNIKRTYEQICEVEKEFMRADQEGQEQNV